MEKAEYYLAFTKYPESLGKHIYTTNVVESVNNLIEKISTKTGGYFNSVEVLEINILSPERKFKTDKMEKTTSNDKWSYL